MTNDTYDFNYHKNKILFQDMPKAATYTITIKRLGYQLKTKFKGFSMHYSKKLYHTNCLLLEDCYFADSFQLLDKPEIIKSGHLCDISFPPSFFTKFRECQGDYLQEDDTVKLEIHITNQKAQGGSTKWIITSIKRVNGGIN